MELIADQFAEAVALEIWGGAMMFLGERVERTHEWKAPELEGEFLLQFNRARMCFERHWNLAAPEALRAMRASCDLRERGSIPRGSAA